MDTVGIALVGCGGMGRGIARRVVDLDSRLQIRALHDPDPRSVQAARDEFGEGLPSYSDVGELLARPDIDWVMIASWNCCHCEQTVAAFEAGKHVFCQKPLALSVDECVRMLRAWKSSGKMFNIGFTLRYSPHYRRVRRLIADGEIGEIVSMEFNETLDFNHGGYIMGDWRRLRQNAGTHLLEKCCHDIDLTNWMMDARARKAASFGGLNFFRPENAYHIERIGRQHDGKTAYSGWGGLVDLNPFTADKDIVDNQVAILEFDGGKRAAFHTNCNSGIPERRMMILGTEGAIRADVLTGTIETKRIGFDTELQDASTDARGGHGCGDEVLAAELADSMFKATPPSVGLREGVESAVTCFALDDALDTGAVVDLTAYWNQVDAEGLDNGDAG